MANPIWKTLYERRRKMQRLIDRMNPKWTNATVVLNQQIIMAALLELHKEIGKLK